MSEHFIYVFDSPRGLATWRYGWHVSGETMQPLLDAARWLLDLGLADPGDRIAALRGGEVAFFARVGLAARLKVSDAPSRGPRFARFNGEVPERLRRSRPTPQ